VEQVLPGRGGQIIYTHVSNKIKFKLKIFFNVEIHTIGYYPAMTRSKSLTHSAALLSNSNTVLSERRYMQIKVYSIRFHLHKILENAN
jgi:hypothetical protein